MLPCTVFWGGGGGCSFHHEPIFFHIPWLTCGACLSLPVLLQGPKRRGLEATTRRITLAAAAAQKGREQAGTALLDMQAPPPAARPGQKRGRAESVPAAPAAGVTVPTTEAETDSLVAKIMSGELWPRYRP